MDEHAPPPSYLQYVQSLVGRFPRLQLVADFMSPHIRIKGYHEHEHVTQRMRKVDVNVIDLESSCAKRTTFSDGSILSGHLGSTQEPGSTRIILVEDISADVIELLGSKFSLDPRFFENHLRGIHTFLTDQWEGDRTERLESSTSEVLSRDFLTMWFFRAYPFKGWDNTWVARVKLNVPRIGNRVRSLFLRDYASIYGPIQHDGNCSSFVVLCDPLLDDSIPDELYLRNNESIPLYDPQAHYKPSNSQRYQISTRSTLEKALLNSQTQNTSATRTLLIHCILTTALDFNAAALHELSLTGYRLNSGYYNRHKESYNTMLWTINRHGGWINLHEHVYKSLKGIKTICTMTVPDGEARQSIELELSALEVAHADIQQNQIHLLDFLRQEQEIRFASNVERLTTIAFLFLPFSTVATILSIQDTMRFGVFVGMALPIFIICVFVGIRGVSITDTSKVISNWGRNVSLLYMSHLREAFPLCKTEKTVENIDVESMPNSSDTLMDLYKKIAAMQTGHDEQRMSILITELQSMPSLRRRPSGKLRTTSM